MTYIVKDECIKCKHTDCVEVCPVDCFYEGENMLVINPDECIDCGVCEPECPIDAIKADTDENVKGILINIFGGIMRCDVLAQGVVEAAKQVNLSVPLVVRLAGTNFKEGKKILEESKLKILSASDLNDAAKKIVNVIN